MTYSIKSLIENLLSELGKNDTQYKGKIRSILEEQIKPCLTEMLQALCEQYGEDILHDYEEIIKELIN